MTDLTPNERAALQAALEQWYLLPADDESSSLVAIWRAARAFENEACANVAWNTGMDEHKRRGGLPHDCREVGSLCAAAIRERAKGMT